MENMYSYDKQMKYSVNSRAWCKKRRDKPGMGLEAHFMT